VTMLVRIADYFLRYRSLRLGHEQLRRLVVVGSVEESEKVLRLLQKAGVQNNYLGRVATSAADRDEESLSVVDQLAEVVRIYRVEEIVFCSRDIAIQAIMRWMSQLGPHILYKILPEDSLSIIGSHSKNTPGELYTIDIEFRIAQPLYRRNKRLLDLGLALLLLITWPLQWLLVRRPLTLLGNIGRVLAGRLTWVAYAPTETASQLLPRLRPGVLSPEMAFPSSLTDEATRQRLNLFYAKDYALASDLSIIWRGWRELGRRNA
ncbi:MAG: glycosyl transferase family 2, partial [Lewinella sp.]|nr:glycosyl transferase family 2 [Lewinella sp.]